jgi:hypothetical protein
MDELNRLLSIVTFITPKGKELSCRVYVVDGRELDAIDRGVQKIFGKKCFWFEDYNLTSLDNHKSTYKKKTHYGQIFREYKWGNSSITRTMQCHIEYK